MKVIMATLIFIGMTNILGIQMLVPMGKELVVLKSEIAGAIADLIINICLIPKYGAVGAAIGTVIAEIVVWIVQLYALKSDVSMSYRKIHFYGISVATLLSIAASSWVKLLKLPVFFELGMGSILFFGTYGIVLLYIIKEEIVIEIINPLISKLQLIRKPK